MKKINIIPAVLEKKFLKIEDKVKKAEKAKVKLVQIDICDGRLTPEKTFASAGCLDSFERLKFLQKNIDFEIDLIVDMENGPKGKGDKFLESIVYLQPKKVIFHFSGISNWDKVFDKLKGEKIKIALGTWLTDDVRKVNKILEKYKFNYIQIMGIEKVGFGGQKISNKVFRKAKYFSKKYPNLPIQIDGGVKLENAKKLAKNGVSGFVAGSGIYGSDDIVCRLKEFRKEIKVK